MSTRIDHEEHELLETFEEAKLKSVATKDELAKLKANARDSAEDCP